MAAVIAYLDERDPAAAARARERYECLQPYPAESSTRGEAVLLGVSEPRRRGNKRRAPVRRARPPRRHPCRRTTRAARSRATMPTTRNLPDRVLAAGPWEWSAGSFGTQAEAANATPADRRAQCMGLGALAQSASDRCDLLSSRDIFVAAPRYAFLHALSASKRAGEHEQQITSVVGRLDSE